MFVDKGKPLKRLDDLCARSRAKLEDCKPAEQMLLLDLGVYEDLMRILSH